MAVGAPSRAQSQALPSPDGEVELRLRAIRGRRGSIRGREGRLWFFGRLALIAGLGVRRPGVGRVRAVRYGIHPGNRGYARQLVTLGIARWVSCEQVDVWAWMDSRTRACHPNRLLPCHPSANLAPRMAGMDACRIERFASSEGLCVLRGDGIGFQKTLHRTTVHVYIKRLRAHTITNHRSVDSILNRRRNKHTGRWAHRAPAQIVVTVVREMECTGNPPNMRMPPGSATQLLLSLRCPPQDGALSSGQRLSTTQSRRVTLQGIEPMQSSCTRWLQARYRAP